MNCADAVYIKWKWMFDSDAFWLVLFSAVLLAIAACFSGLIWRMGDRLRWRWLKYVGLSVVPLYGCWIFAVIGLQVLGVPLITLFLALVFNIPLLLVSIVSAGLWQFGQRRQLRWLKYSGLSCFSLFLVLLTVLTVEWAGAVQQSVDIPGYRVELVEKGGIEIEYSRYFYVYRPDGQRASYLIHNDAPRCFYPNVQAQGDRIYFQCAGESLTGASFVDTAKKTVRSNFNGDEILIAELNFSPPSHP